MAGFRGLFAPTMQKLPEGVAVRAEFLQGRGPESLTSNQARDPLEIVDDRYDKGSIRHGLTQGIQMPAQ
jgi:hypothetical protein